MMQTALAKAREEGADVELVSLAGKTVHPCDACMSCRKTGKCHIKDDMQEIYAKLSEADGIIFGTPVYFWSVTAQAKALIDRTVPLNGKLKNKPVGIVVTTARSGSAVALGVFSYFCTIHQMIVVGRATGFTGIDGYENKEAIKNDVSGMAQAETLGKTLAKFIQTRKIPD